MQENFEIDAVSRSDQGKGASRRLRREGLVPGIIYGSGKDPEMFATKHNELIKHLDHEAFYSHILTVKVDGKAQKVVLKDLQRHPAKPFVTHVDLMRVRMDEAIRMTVPLHFEGEEGCPGVKARGTLLRGMTELEIECLPNDLPEYIAVDVSKMEIDDIIHLSQVAMPKGVSLVGWDKFDEENDPMVVTIEVMRGSVDDEAGGTEAEAVAEVPKPKAKDEQGSADKD
ncbi:MAG: 50S ribosomal protein L25/general stress protein Ctc [Chromatiaceae bacterium]|jgi:large subunit ribosomal protein L25|nr:50S ribosomal protein L25/general stress protein Ctc [Chromatiaceae bacterium]